MLIIAILLAAAPVPAITAELRAEAPYLACAAQEADGAAASAATIQTIQANAQTKCETWLEQNVENSLVAVGASKARDADWARERLRTGLRTAFLTVIERRVTAQRQAVAGAPTR
jgi:hypothetical protein